MIPTHPLLLLEKNQESQPGFLGKLVDMKLGGYRWLRLVTVGCVGWGGDLGGDDSRGHSAVAFVIPEFFGLGDFLVRNGGGGWGDFHEMMGRQTWLYRYTPENYEFTPAKRGSQKIPILTCAYFSKTGLVQPPTRLRLFFRGYKTTAGQLSGAVEMSFRSIAHGNFLSVSTSKEAYNPEGSVSEVLSLFSPTKTTISRCKGGTQKPVI